ncbi:MAG: associated Golgi protein-like protein [Symbiobacteriaceae bacterium]|nr:associated Golgi protein-like protein [Symbiobacteriaceae bacterium]
MPAALSAWFTQHYYLAILAATLVEGLGLPLPAEALFIAVGLLVGRGEASLGVVILLAALGNLMGSFITYSIAYIGGKKLLARATETSRIKPESLREVDRFFARYGAATIFISRFVGFIRAATIFSSGVVRVEPWRFVVYTFAAALVWNGGWAFLAYHFGAGLPHLLHRFARHPNAWVVGLVLLTMGLGIFFWLRRRRNPAGS